MDYIKIHNSSMIAEIGYDDNSSVLQVKFINGREVNYENVPKNVYKDFIAAESVGKYYNANIKGKY